MIAWAPPAPTATFRLQRFFRTPKGLLLIVFALLLALAVPSQGSAVLPGLLAATATAAALDAGIIWARTGEWEFPSGAILTGLIIAFVLSAQEPLYVPIVAAGVAVASKHIFRTRWSNIFNPAALALVAVALLFNSGQSWWGALPDLGPLGILVMFAAGLFIADRINKLPLVLVVIGSYFLMFTTASLVGDPSRVAEVFREPDLQATLFFAFFMVDDPPTCPTKYRDQVQFGIIVAVVSYAIFMIMGSVYYLPAGLLAGNAWESGRRYLVGRRRVRPATA